MSTDCPACRSEIATGDINVSTDLALCRACGNSFRFSEIAGELSPVAPDPLRANLSKANQNGGFGGSLVETGRFR